MRTSGVFTTHYFTIPYENYGEPIYILPFGDVHKSSPMHCKERWGEWLEWAKQKPRAYFLGMGDYNDLASTSERMILDSKALHESTRQTLNDVYTGQVEAFAQDIEFMRGRLIGVINGNHYAELPGGENTDMMLARLMGSTYLGVCAFIRLSFVHPDRNTRASLDIFAHHGRGGTSLSASTAALKKMTWTAEADIYLMGDNHQKHVDGDTRLKLRGQGDKARLVQRKMLLARTGSFLKGYEPGKESYIVDALYSPSSLGTVKIELTPRRERGESDTVHIDIHASI